MNIKNGGIVEEPFVLLPQDIVTPERILQRGDLAVCMSNGSKLLVGKSAAINAKDHFHTVGAFCAIFRSNNTPLQEFVQHLFQSATYSRHITIALAGSSINNLKNGDIEEMRFSIPADERELMAIAKILSTANSEIESIVTQIHHLRTEKRALMQQLLTGKRRVKP